MRVVLRPGRETDHGFVIDTFVRSHANAGGLSYPAVADGAKRLIRRILAKPSTRLEVVAEETDKNKIVGVAVTDPALSALWWVYTRERDRKCGVARTLLTDAKPPLRCATVTRGAAYVARCVELRYDPLLLLEI